MSYGKLSVEQQAAIKPFIVGKAVYDLGAGDGELARLLIHLGARRVVAVDKAQEFKGDKQILHRTCYFKDFKGRADLVFLSWPANYRDDALLRLIKRAKFVVYLGKNTGGTACGWRELYEEFNQRQIVVHIPELKNTLTCYSPNRGVRAPTGEEFAGIYNEGEFLSFSHAENIAKTLDELAKKLVEANAPTHSEVKHGNVKSDSRLHAGNNGRGAAACAQRAAYSFLPQESGDSGVSKSAGLEARAGS